MAAVLPKPFMVVDLLATVPRVVRYGDAGHDRVVLELGAGVVC